MVIKILSPQEVSDVALRTIGLREGLDVGSPEALAAIVRRAACFRAPCSWRTVREAAQQCLRGLTTKTGELSEAFDATIEALIAYGDLLDLRPTSDEVGSTTSSLLYLAPPAFVQRTSGAVFLIGIAPDLVLPLPVPLQKRVEYARHVRRLLPRDQEDLGSYLEQLGLLRLSESDWLKRPSACDPGEFVRRIDDRLGKSVTTGEVPGLVVLDFTRPVDFYSGRWAQPQRRTGRFVARRDQAYGNPLWSYVELAQGKVVKLFDFVPDEWGACNHAWRLQLAIDAVRLTPQVYRLSASSTPGSVLVTFFSPLPQWATRRWDLIGERVSVPKSLFAYQLPAAEFEQERKFLLRELWLAELA